MKKFYQQQQRILAIRTLQAQVGLGEAEAAHSELLTALHAEELVRATEDRAQVSYAKNLCQGDATLSELEAFAVAGMRAAKERLQTVIAESEIRYRECVASYLAAETERSKIEVVAEAATRRWKEHRRKADQSQQDDHFLWKLLHEASGDLTKP